MADATEIRVLTLEDGADHTTTLYRLQKGWQLHFKLGTSLVGNQTRLFTNHQVNNDANFEFHSTKFYELPFVCGSHKYDMVGSLAKLVMRSAGSFSFYLTTDGGNKQETAVARGYFLVDPELCVGRDRRPLPLDAISLQTYVTKYLGPFSVWERALSVSQFGAYNMVHFTPVQELGYSHSAYSIRDQLKICGAYGNVSWEQMGQLIQKLDTEWGVLSMTDLVLNHTARDTAWLREYPDSAYNLVNCPYLRPAYLLDRTVFHLSESIAKGECESRGVPAVIQNEDHIRQVGVLLSEAITRARLHEFFLLHLDNIVAKFRDHLDSLSAGHGSQRRRRSSSRSLEPETSERSDLCIIQDQLYRRLRCTVDFDVLARVMQIDVAETRRNEAYMNSCASRLRAILERLNAAKFSEIQNHLNEAVRNVQGHMRYHFLDPSGPRFGRVTRHSPIAWKYFAFPPDVDSQSVERDEVLMATELACLVAACNGWVMNDDPLRNFAESDSNVYIRRELIVWGDSVKLRYGKSPEDAPFLWDYMRQYAETTARCFHAVRLDNCHSTPLHVAEWLLEHARRVRPDLYVVAELFTNLESLDNVFVNRLGINSLIRECSTAADCHEQGRLVHRFGGDPVGAFLRPCTRPLTPSMAHALLFDQTHDNPAALLTRSVYDLLPTAAICSLACCAVGSVRSYDEMVPHAVDVVKETRRYPLWTAAQQNVADIRVIVTSDNDPPASAEHDIHAHQVPVAPKASSPARPEDLALCVDANTGILPARRLLNALHAQLAERGYSEIYVDQMNADLVAITRHNPRTHESYVLASRTAFHWPGSLETGSLPSMTVAGQLDRVVLEASLRRVKQRSNAAANSEDEAAQFAEFASLTAALRAPLDCFAKDSAFINGLTGFNVALKSDIDPEHSDVIRATRTPDGSSRIEFINFPPGSIVIVKASLSSHAKTSFSALCEKLHLRGHTSLGSARHSAMTLSGSRPPDASNLLVLASRIDDLNAFNRALYRSEQEEKQEDQQAGAYGVPNSGSLIYCGLQGAATALEPIALNNNLGHPLCENLRRGDWLLDYTVHRLIRNAATKDLGLWLEAAFSLVRTLPRFLIPRYFHLVLSYAQRTILTALSTSKLGDFVRDCGDDPFSFPRRLAYGSVILCAHLADSDLPELSPSLAAPLPRTVESKQATMSLAAGLPHFAAGIWRNWGRDTFIAMRGLLLLTERFQDARYLILAYAGCLRHGLIPNLLGSGVCARYNARDAVWWWLYAIRMYATANRHGGADLLRDRVTRLYPTDDSPMRPAGAVEQSLAETMQEALERHARGLSFRERNAGPAIDREMLDPGFDNRIEVDWRNGFVKGGNRHNCGTWMDKMGSSDYAGNRGHPATPRDGSAIEIVALSYAVVSWLAQLHDAGLFPYAGVRVPAQVAGAEDVLISYSEWANKIRDNFESHFYIDVDQSKWPSDIVAGFVHRCGIYKDVVGSSDGYPDYQLRPNQCIAMVVAPELFDVQHARIALKQVETLLLAPLGMRTLDPSDLAYVGDYHNHDESQNYRTAHGFNYHNGPEWLWLTGYFLRAKLRFCVASESSSLSDETLRLVNRVLSRQEKELVNSEWCGLPELTNKNGSYCADGCPAQAWSMGCALEVLYDLAQLANTGTL